MNRLRIGTRGSKLALWQTDWVAQRLREAHPSLTIERVIIRTHGDDAVHQRFDADWPVGGFVGAIEQALSRNEIDLAVHSYKDLPTESTPGLVVAAVPMREIVHDVLVTREPTTLEGIGPGFRVGTSSPRRSAQMRRLAEVEIVPIRGNVPTRIAKLESEPLDGVILAAAGLRRLGLTPPHRLDLPVDRFLPSPAQGALAVQTRQDDPARALAAVLDDAPTRRRVTAERAFLRTIEAGCHVPLGALADLNGETVVLHGQLFSDDGTRCAEGTESGDDPSCVGETLARRLKRELEDGS